MAVRMLILVVFTVLFSFSYAANVRIVNGTDAKEGEFPFVVSLKKNGGQECGATILDERHVLTAAHCVCDNRSPLNPSLYSIQYGSVQITETSERTVPVAEIYCDNFTMANMAYDAAVLVLAQPLSQDYPWQPVTLYRDFDTSVAHRGVVIGWGMLWAVGPIPSVLQKLEVDVYPDSLCGYNKTLQVCLGANVGGICNGDSGSPLMVEGKQVGMSSLITGSCGTANEEYPNVYSKVTASLAFIDNIVNSH